VNGRWRVEAGAAVCALCHEAIDPSADAVVTPDFIANEADPFFRFSDASMHRACFVVWDQRKAFVARFNRVGRSFPAEDGTYPQMTAEGELVRRRRASPEAPRMGLRKRRPR
jgi:hypothetical protein